MTLETRRFGQPRRDFFPAPVLPHHLRFTSRYQRDHHESQDRVNSKNPTGMPQQFRGDRQHDSDNSNVSLLFIADPPKNRR
jgi:hypothetical protein